MTAGRKAVTKVENLVQMTGHYLAWSLALKKVEMTVVSLAQMMVHYLASRLGQWK